MPYTKCHKQWYLVLLTMMYSISYFYRNSIGPIADVLEREFETTVTYVAMLSSFLYASYFCMQLVVGMLLEIYSFRIIILFASLFLGLAMITFSFLPDITTGIIVRFLSGFITSFPFVTGCAVASQLKGNHFVAMYSGILFCCGNLLLFSMNYVQAFLFEKYNNWRSIYFYFGVFSIVIFIGFLLITIYEYMHQRRSLIIRLGPTEFVSCTMMYIDITEQT